MPSPLRTTGRFMRGRLREAGFVHCKIIVWVNPGLYYGFLDSLVLQATCRTVSRLAWQKQASKMNLDAIPVSWCDPLVLNSFGSLATPWRFPVESRLVVVVSFRD